jgi:Pentapeptide repeats (8 copies)
MGNRKSGLRQEPSRKEVSWWKRLYRWTGWRGKTLWDWQALLFVPVTIALIASLITLYQTIRQQEIEKDRAQAAQQLEAISAERAMVQAYLEDMGIFLLEKDLRTEGENSDVRLLARARTLAVLDVVSGDREVRVLEFLSETKLIQFGPQDEPPVISLSFADLREAPLRSRFLLSNTDLDRAELNKAKLPNANLRNANLSRADLPKANLSGADLTRADLTRADLTRADLTHATLSDANLSDAKGRFETGARMRGADLAGADLGGADLTNAEITKEQLEEAESLEGATMPNGQKYEEWLKSKDRGEEGENGGS